jgi:NAD(P)-dependent dehydrogenase (short-subunit alcohol dehydrogenase family)
MATERRGWDVQGKVALVTGANRGIGEAFVRGLIAAGAAKVYAAARDPRSADHLAAECPGKAIPVELDVTRADQVATAAARCGDVSILVNNAGVFRNVTLLGAPDMSAMREEMEVNFFGVMAMCRAFAPVLARNGGGAIVNVLSSAAIVAVPNMGGYSPSKFATRAAGVSMRAELAGQGTQVSSLIVGSVDTRMAAHVAGRKERPEDIAAAGVAAIRKGIDEMDTDTMAVEIRASMARDPKALERQLARLLGVSALSTGR